MQLGRTVRSARHQRHVCVVGLHDGRVELGGGGPAGRQHDRRPSGDQPEPERVEPRRPLVEVHVDADLGPGIERQRERRRPRARRHHRVDDPSAHPLVDHGGGEGRLYGHGR